MGFIQMLSASWGNRQGEIIMFVKGPQSATIDFPSCLLGAKLVFRIKLNSCLKKKKERKKKKRWRKIFLQMPCLWLDSGTI